MKIWREVVVVVVFSVLSAVPVVAMLWKGLDLRIVEPLILLVVEAYDNAALAILGSLEPYVLAALQFIDVDVDLEPHWRHVFVFMWLYFLNDARIFGATGRVVAAWFGRVWGALAAFAASIASGLIPVGSTDFLDNFFFSAFPIIGYFVYAMGVGWANGHWHRVQVAQALRQEPEPYWDFFFTRAFRAAKIATAGFAIAAVGLVLIPLAPGGEQVQAPSLFVLGFLVYALGVFWLARGIYQGWGNARKPGAATLRQEVWTIGNTRLGLVMLGAISSAVATVLLATDLLG